MIGTKRHIGRSVAIALMLICLSLSVFYSKEDGVPQRIQTITFTDTQLNGTRAIDIQRREQEEDNPIRFTLWGQIKGQEVLNPDLYRSVILNVLIVYGDSSLILNANGALGQDDYEGCMISEDIAFQLFKSSSVINQVVKYNNKLYTIRGTVPNAEKVFMIQASSLTKETMDHISVEITKGQRIAPVIKELVNRHGFPDHSRNDHVYYIWSESIIAIMLLVMGAGILVPLIKIVIEGRQRPVLCLLMGIFTILFLLAFIWIVKDYFHYPEEMIPNKWSDIEFYRDFFNQKWEDFLSLLQTEKSIVQMLAMKPFSRVLKYSVWGMLLYGFFVSKIEIQNTSILYFYLVAAVFFSYIGILFSKNVISEVAQSRVIWFIMIFYLGGKYVKNIFTHLLEDTLE